MSRPAGRRRPGPEPQIDEDRIVSAALHLGLADVTMRAVAEHLGVAPPSLYHHVANREGLVALAAARLLARFELPEPGGATWDAWLREGALRLDGQLAAHPGLAAAVVRAVPDAPGVLDVTAAALDVLVGHYRLPAGPALRAVWAVHTTVFAHAAHTTPDGLLHLAGRATSDGPARERLAATLRSTGLADREQLAFALDALLGGLVRLVQPSDPRASPAAAGAHPC